jgi:diguanylate cyclase (GGDEF)-like protein/putative nucleotidyltransferase with HDIG domain
MSLCFVVPLAALAVYALLLARIVTASRSGTRAFLLLYLISCAAWAFTALVLHGGFFPHHSSLFGKLLPALGLWVLVAFSQLVCSMTGSRVRPWLAVGYAFVAGFAGLTALEYAPETMPYLAGPGPQGLGGAWQYLFIAGVVWFSTLPMILLWRSYRVSMDPSKRNQVQYLMVGASLAALTNVRMVIPAVPNYPLEHVGHLGNALLITLALTSHHLPDFKSAARRGLVYVSTSMVVAPLYLLALWGLVRFSTSWTAPASVATIVGMVFVLPWLLIALRKPIGRTVDRILYRERLAYRKMILSFPSKMSNVLSLRDLAAGMLRPIPKALDASNVGLLLPSNGEFTLEFADHLASDGGVAEMKISRNSLIVRRLAESAEPLFRECLDAEPEFQSIPQAERDAIERTDTALLVPMQSKGTLVGILALGRKQSNASYSTDDIGLLMKLSRESATPIGNAHLHYLTRERVHTDELTELFSHGYFHQRIDEEISRCSRLGSIFSVLFLDIDMFKSYNDAFGHLAGDTILRQIAQSIRASSRDIDIAFRYGGDEFAILLPESSLDDASYVAERIRKRIESEMDSKGIALTCSIGIAAWPTNGVTREGVLQAADKALYWSKQAGRNRISLASDMDLSWDAINGINGQQEILSAVHALAATVDAKDPNTYGHSKKTSQYAAYIAQAMGYPEDKIATIRAAALLHDIGKIRMSDRLLTKDGPLTDEEWLSMREHPKFGVAILKHIKDLSACLPTIQHHHERFDGSGYPAALAGPDIPLDARILTVADAYDAMTSPRPYRNDRLPHHEAVDELARCSGTHFDPDIVKLFAALWEPLDSRPAGTGLSRLTRRSAASVAQSLACARRDTRKLITPSSTLVVPFSPRKSLQ